MNNFEQINRDNLGDYRGTLTDILGDELVEKIETGDALLNIPNNAEGISLDSKLVNGEVTVIDWENREVFSFDDFSETLPEPVTTESDDDIVNSIRDAARSVLNARGPKKNPLTINIENAESVEIHTSGSAFAEQSASETNNITPVSEATWESMSAEDALHASIENLEASTATSSPETEEVPAAEPDTEIAPAPEAETQTPADETDQEAEPTPVTESEAETGDEKYFENGESKVFEREDGSFRVAFQYSTKGNTLDWTKNALMQDPENRKAIVALEDGTHYYIRNNSIFKLDGDERLTRATLEDGEQIPKGVIGESWKIGNGQNSLTNNSPIEAVLISRGIIKENESPVAENDGNDPFDGAENFLSSKYVGINFDKEEAVETPATEQEEQNNQPENDDPTLVQNPESKRLKLTRMIKSLGSTALTKVKKQITKAKEFYTNPEKRNKRIVVTALGAVAIGGALFGLDQWIFAHHQNEVNQMVSPLTPNKSNAAGDVFKKTVSSVSAR